MKRGDIVIVHGVVNSFLHEPVRGTLKVLQESPGEHIVFGRDFNGEWPEYHYRCLFKSLCRPTKCMVLGWTIRKVGPVSKGVMSHSYEYGNEWEPGSMKVDKEFRVWMLVPLDSANRYRVPIAAFEEQIEVIDAQDPLRG